MIAPTIALFVMSFLGICGLVVLAGRGTEGSPHQLAELRSELAAKGRLIDALERKASAFENLANERGKTLAVYRGASRSSGFGIPAEQLGGGNGG
jgi:hypothetical protein